MKLHRLLWTLAALTAAVLALLAMLAVVWGLTLRDPFVTWSAVVLAVCFVGVGVRCVKKGWMK